MFDIWTNFDLFHYSAYIGPALNALAGRIPLVDIFGQYGPNYLLYTIIYAIGFPRTYTVAAAVSSVVTVIMYFSFFLVTHKLLQHKFLAVIGGTICVLAIHNFYPYDPNITPSVGGMRFMSPMALLAALAYLPSSKMSSIPSCLAFTIGILWSVESAIACVCLSAIFGYARSLRNPSTALLQSVRYGLILSMAAVVLMLVSLAIKSRSGEWPRFDLYLGLVSAYRDPTNPVSHIWITALPSGFFFWVPYAIALFVIAASEAEMLIWMTIRPTSSIATLLRSDERYTIAKCTAALGAIQFLYFVGRSHPVSLDSVSLPFAILFLYIFDTILWRLRGFLAGGKTAATPGVTFSIPTVFAFARFFS